MLEKFRLIYGAILSGKILFYDGKYRWMMRHYSFTIGFEENAVALECGASNGKHW
jgi:hypothetical protein